MTLWNGVPISWRKEANTPTCDFSLVLACYCEEPHLFENVMTICSYLEATRFSFELIFVEDASPDGTFAEVMRCHEALKARGIQHKIAQHTCNAGRGKTVQDGFSLCEGRMVGFIDVDLEHPIDGVLPMLLRIASGRCDAVVAKRISDKSNINPIIE